jgi:GNAT superfamily N-acetyltransferase
VDQCDNELDLITGSIKFSEDIDENDADEITIGEFKAYFLTNGIENFCVQLDDYSIDSQAYADELKHITYHEMFEDCFRLIVLSEIKIDEDYRGNGVLKKVIETLEHYFLCPIFVKPYPLQHGEIINNNKELFDYEQYKKDLKKVKTAYKKCGFKTIRKRSEYMVYY